MQLKKEWKDRNNLFERTVRALKAARLLKGISRNEAATRVGWSPSAFEQIENGRCNFSKKRVQKIIAAYGYSDAEFERILHDPKLALANVCEQGKTDHTVARKPRRNHFKIITKEVRVIRILRMRRKISQYHASYLCNYVPGCFGHIEVGRITLTKARIDHILDRLGYTRKDFDLLMNASVLRDEILDDAVSSLRRLDDQALTSALNIIKALIK